MSNQPTFLVPIFLTVCYSASLWFLVFDSVQISSSIPLPIPKVIQSQSYRVREQVFSKEISIENVSSTTTTSIGQRESPDKDSVWSLSRYFHKSISDTKYYNKSTSLTLGNSNFSNVTTSYERESRQLSSLSKSTSGGNPSKIHADATQLNGLNSNLGNDGTHNVKVEREEYKVDYETAHIDAIRVQDIKNGVTYESGGVSVFLANESATIMLLGHNFTNSTLIAFVTEEGKKGYPCDVRQSENQMPPYTLSDIGPGGTSAIVSPSFPSINVGKSFYICTRESNSESDDPWIHQGTDPWVTVKTSKRFLPFWLQVVLIIVLLFISGLFAGLTLGLLALDRTDLKILMSTGSENERKYASLILPLREKGNYLLCSLVLGNVLVNSTLTILLDDLTSGLFAVILATVGIVIIGEILPQAVCSRYGLEIGAKTIWITKCVMLLTFPVSYIISKILDKLLGEEIGFVYNRENLKELITVTSDHNNLEADEVNIISGALTMRKKTVEDIMTPLEQIYMLPTDSLLDYNTLREIRTEGYSRIPIYENSRTNIVSVLQTKDLIFVDPDDCTPLHSLAAGHANECFFILGDTTLDVVFKEFNETKRGHMAFVQKIDSADEDRDPVFVTIGLITLEDVIEELIQYNRQIKD